jgi:two-component system, NtrC family, sensor kinase
MNIRNKTLLVIAFAVVVSAMGNFLVLERLVFPTFVTLEETAASRDMQRAIEAINAEMESLSVTLWDYANWDDAYEYMKGRSPNFPGENLNYDNLSKFDVDVVEAYSTDLKLKYKTTISEDDEELKWSFKDIDQDGTFFDFDNTPEVKGLAMTTDGLIMFASRPVKRTSGEGDSAGTFIFGHFLDAPVIAAIKTKTKIELELIEPDRMFPDENGQDSLDEQTLLSGAPLIKKDGTGTRLVTYSLLRDYRGEPIRILKSQIKRDITASGRRVVLFSMVGVAISGLLVMVAAALLLQWLLIGPLVKLTEHIVAIGGNVGLSRRLAVDRSDEIGILSREFDSMLGRLAEARDRLLEHSFHSGLAEMASGVLHNIRNHLSPLSMRVGRMYQEVAQDADTKLDTALAELIDSPANADRRMKLSRYVQLSLHQLAERRTKVLGQLAAVSSDLRQLDGIMNELDRFGRASNQLEAIPVYRVVEDTIPLLPNFQELDVRIVIDPQFDKRILVMSTSFILKHVLHNLFVNAIEATIATGKKIGQIEVSHRFESIDGRAAADLRIRDEGIGITATNLSTIFGRGFTTKIGERRGTGLHWCANSISAMGGKLFATSPGLGHGATFHLILPLADVTERSAA